MQNLKKNKEMYPYIHSVPQYMLPINELRYLILSLAKSMAFVN